MVDFPTKRSATEANRVSNGPNAQEEKPYNHVDDEITTRLQNVPREVRKSVTEGYRTGPVLPRPADKDVPIFRSHRDDLIYTLDLISPHTVRANELQPLFERLERPGARNGSGSGAFSLPNFPGRSGERKRRMERETSPSSSAGNSPVPSPMDIGMEHDGFSEDVDMDVDLGGPSAGPGPATMLQLPPPVVQSVPIPRGREIRPRPRRTMKNVQSAPAGGLMFGGGTWPVDGQNELADVDDEPWREVDFTAFANKPPE